MGKKNASRVKVQRPAKHPARRKQNVRLCSLGKCLLADDVPVFICKNAYDTLFAQAAHGLEKISIKRLPVLRDW